MSARETSSTRRLLRAGCWVFLSLLLIGSQPSAAQMFQCPPGSVSVGGGGGMMCQCADGSFASIYGCAPSQQPQQTAPRPPVGDHCSNGGTCPVGQRCGIIPGYCIPNGMVDCGHYMCQQGSFCGSGNACLAQGSDDCGGGKSCGPGTKCSRSRTMCLAEGSIDCGSYTCPSGSKCARERKACLAVNAVDCGSFDCNAGSKCGSGNQCLAQTAIDCGGGKSCSAGNVCVKGGEECLTPQQVAQRAEDEKKRKIAEDQRAKEAKDAQDFIKQERIRITAEEKKKAADAAKQKAEDTKRAANAAKQTPKDGQVAAAAASQKQPGSKPAEGAALNSNLKDIQSISSNPPPKSGTQESASTFQQPKNPALNCSTFRNPAGDATIGPDGCPKPGYESKVPANPQTPPQEQKATQMSAKPDRSQAKTPPRHLVSHEDPDCPGLLYQPARIACASKGGGRLCKITTTTMYCEKGLFGRNVNCTAPEIQISEQCR